METIIIAVLLLVAAQTTYLTVTQLVTTKRKMRAPVFIDTSVLIDGRIVPIAQSGFFTRPLYVPRSVVGELQFLADHADSDKRARARHGLDVINQLQALTTVSVTIFADGVHAKEGVDNRLLTLAKRHHGAICTVDYNLNKVAVVESIEVLNVNDLAKTLRMAYLPGEKAIIELTQRGNDNHQGVGHLGDGTMVVVEQGAKFIGTSVEVEFIRSLQTAAGKMMFAKLTSSTTKVAPKKNPAAMVQKAQILTDIGEQRRQNKTVGRAPREQASKSVRSGARSDAQQSSKPQVTTRHNNRSSRRRSPEDNLVELANR